MGDAREERVKEELSRRQPFDDAHGAHRSGDMATAFVVVRDGRFDRWRWGAGKRLATLGQPAGAAARREEAEIADADEALREDVEQEAAEKFVDVERERPHLTAVPIVLPAKRDGVVGHVDEPVVRDGDAVGVAREVVQHVGRAAEGRLGVDHPRLTIERSEERAEGARRVPSGARLPGKYRRPCRNAVA